MKLKTKFGMVVSGHKKASQAGMKILKNGGNAMDAAIATAATLSIAIPNMNGLGGDSIALWYSSKNKKILTINGSGKSPKKANISYFKSLGLKKIPQRSSLSITVPGVVDAWDTSLKKFGKKKLKDVLNDAIKLAENGIKIDKYLNNFLKGDVYKKLIKNNKNLSDIYGLPKDIKLGKIIKQKKLAETLKILAKRGSKSFYKGSLSKIILRDLQLQGSILDKNDFSNHSTLIQKPINTEYFGKSVFSAPPNSQGLALIGLCNMFNNINQKIEINNYLKVKKEIFLLRDMYCLDPSISKLYQDKNKLKKIQGNFKKVSGDTSTLVVIDKYGNAVSWVQSLFEEFGSGIVSPNTGIVFHNRMYLEKISKKGHNKLKSQKRPFHTLCPAIVLDKKDLDLTIATPGDHGQPQTIFQVLNYIYNFKYSIKKAILTPRIRHNQGNEILVEKGFNKNFKNLKNKKIKFKVYNKPHRIFGGVTAIKVNSNKTLSKGVDKRRNCF
jgi:gamma-glutamyltranspeptidase